MSNALVINLTCGWRVGVRFASVRRELGDSELQHKHEQEMKKTNAKSSKSPTPATPSTKTRKKAPTETSQPASPVATPPPVALKASAIPSVKAATSVPVHTKIIANLDVGFGNALYVRGDGPGLTWNQGIPMECVASDQWELVLGESARPISFKILLNDATWCTGPDSTVASGATITLRPEFV